MWDQEEIWLRSKCHTSEGPYLFPFAPNSNWKQAPVFIVGLNPVAAFREEFQSFDHYWSALTCCPDIYYEVNKLKYLERRNAKSRTSQRIQRIIKELIPINVLITNICSYPTADPLMIPRHIKKEPLHERIISRLILICHPKVILFHGAEARKFGEGYFNVKLNPNEDPLLQNVVSQIPGTNNNVTLFAYHHLVGRVDPKYIVEERLKYFIQAIRCRIDERGS